MIKSRDYNITVLLKGKPIISRTKSLKTSLKEVFKLRKGITRIISGLDLFLALRLGLSEITRSIVLKKALIIRVL
jgi:hypothetical protein